MSLSAIDMKIVYFLSLYSVRENNGYVMRMDLLKDFDLATAQLKSRIFKIVIRLSRGIIMIIKVTAEDTDYRTLHQLSII